MADEVILEAFFQAPLVNILVDAFQQFLAVVIDQFAGQHDNAWLACLITGIQHLSQLSGKRNTGLVIQIASRIVNNTGFGGIGNNDLQIIGNSHLHHLVEAAFLVRVQAAGHRGNDALIIYLLTILAAAQIQSVQAFLLIDHLCKAGSDGLRLAALAVPAGPRLNRAAFAIPVGLFVCQIEPVVDECPEEVAFTELQYLLRCIFQNIAFVAGFL